MPAAYPRLPPVAKAMTSGCVSRTSLEGAVPGGVVGEQHPQSQVGRLRPQALQHAVNVAGVVVGDDHDGGIRRAVRSGEPPGGPGCGGGPGRRLRQVRRHGVGAGPEPQIGGRSGQQVTAGEPSRLKGQAVAPFEAAPADPLGGALHPAGQEVHGSAEGQQDPCAGEGGVAVYPQFLAWFSQAHKEDLGAGTFDLAGDPLRVGDRSQFAAGRGPHPRDPEPRAFPGELPGQQALVIFGTAEEADFQAEFLGPGQERGGQVAAGQAGPAASCQPLRLGHQRGTVDEVDPVHDAAGIGMQGS